MTDYATWVERKPIATTSNWRGVSISDDAQRLVVSSSTYDGSNQFLYTSADGGVTWIPRTPSTVRLSTAVAASADGKYILIGGSTGSNGGVAYSSDYGVTWVKTSLSTSIVYSALAVSATGQHMVAAANGQPVQVSTDYGVTWTPKNILGSHAWYRVTMTGDASKLFLIDITGTTSYNVYVTTDLGSSYVWKPAPTKFTTIGVSRDGSKILGASSTAGLVYTSTDGATWSVVSGLPSAAYSSVGWNADGTVGWAALANGGIYITDDGGATWTLQTTPGSKVWSYVAMNATRQLFASVSGGNTWTADTTPGLIKQSWQAMYYGSIPVKAVYFGSRLIWKP